LRWASSFGRKWTRIARGRRKLCIRRATTPLATFANADKRTTNTVTTERNCHDLFKKVFFFLEMAVVFFFGDHTFAWHPSAVRLERFDANFATNSKRSKVLFFPKSNCHHRD
jgi:hypothetical protein